MPVLIFFATIICGNAAEERLQIFMYLFILQKQFSRFLFQFFFYNNPILLTDLWKSEAVSKISSHNVINYLNFDARALKRKFLRRIKHVPFRLPEIYFLWQEL